MLVHWIWLATRPGLNDRVRVEVLRRFRDPEDVYYADKDAFSQVDGLTTEGVEALRDKDLGMANKILAQCADKNIHILTYQEAAYPARLKNISDPPLVLYYKGRLPDLESRPVIGVVGTRKATSYGLTAGRRMGYQIAKCGGMVVSGMAYGIDGVAMSGALSADGIVVGVLGCGVDVVYPASNRALFAEMERRGCLISEYPPQTPPAKWNFPKRNRIISGLSNGVLVVEAPQRSGALITARQAADQGRDVFVVPGNIDVAACAGSNALLRDGAMMVSSGWDILSEYEAAYPGTVCQSHEAEPEPGHDPQPLKVAQKPRSLAQMRPSKDQNEKKEIDNGPPEPYSDGENAAPSLTAEERLIVERLKHGSCLTDDVIAATGLTAGKLLAVLTMLEVRGIVRKLPGNMLELK